MEFMYYLCTQNIKTYKKKMKKVFVILSLVATTFALTSCGGSATEETTTVDSTAVDSVVVETVDSTEAVVDTVAAVDTVSVN